jgi:putative ABC transport system permease protein
MILHYMRIAWRVLTRNKVYASINVAGLGLGVCACLVIGTIVRYEFSFDRLQPDRDRIYRVTTDERITKDMPLMVAPNVPPELGGAIRSGVPGVEVVAPYHVLTDAKVNIPGNRNIFATTTPIVTGAEYFHIMPYEWLAGNPETALTEPFKIVISENKARQYFGDLPTDRIIGRTIVYDDSLTVSVTGVVRDWTANTNFPYTEFISLASTTQPWLRGTLELDAADRKDMPLSSRVLLKLKPGTDPATVNKVLASLFRQTLHPGLYTAARPCRTYILHRLSVRPRSGRLTNQRFMLYQPSPYLFWCWA